MLRFSTGLFAVCLLMFIAVVPTPVLSATAHHVTASTYRDSAFSFAYPAGWTSLPRTQARSIKVLFSQFRHQMTVTDVGGVVSTRTGSLSAAIIVIRLKFSQKLQRRIRGNRPQVIHGFLRGVAGSGGRVISEGPGTIGGHPASAIETAQGTGAVSSHQKIYIFVPVHMKRMFAVVFVARPKSGWPSLVSTFTSVAASMTFR